MSDLDDAFRAAQSLEPDERLQLVARLWKSLPDEHRAALVTLHLEDSISGSDRPDFHRPDAAINPFWQAINEQLFDRSHASGLYSAPRRFDLATIFVVTAAYSLLLGGLSAFGTPPVLMVVIAGLMAIIAAAQAMFLQAFNPRGVSIVTGAIALPVMLWIIWLTPHNALPRSFLATLFFGIPLGAVAGYLLGTLVGGVFLVADLLRGKFERRSQIEPAEEGAGSENSSAGDPNRLS